MPSSNPTNGLHTQARVALSQSALTLIMSGGTNTNEKLTATVTATVKDLSGATQSGTIYWTSSDPSVATVNESGLITAVSPGVARVEASTPALGNTIALFNADGTPHNKIYAELTVTVQNGFIQPDFYFTVSSLGGNQYQIQQHAEDKSTWSGAVTYLMTGGLGLLGTISGPGATLNFISSSPNFVINGTWILGGQVQTYHTAWSTWVGFKFPLMSVRGSTGGFGVGGYSSASSGQPYILPQT